MYHFLASLFADIKTSSFAYLQLLQVSSARYLLERTLEKENFVGQFQFFGMNSIVVQD